MPTLNYTTTKTVDTTVGELTKMLSRRGVASIATRFDEDGEPDGLAFDLRTPHGIRGFLLEVNVEGMHALLYTDPAVLRRGKQFTTVQHARKVAWRVVRDWLEAQLALVDADMATMDQVMLPYLLVAPDVTLYDRYVEREQAALESGGGR